MNRKMIGMVISVIAVALIAFVIVLALRQNAPEQEDAVTNDSSQSAQSESDKKVDADSGNGNTNSGVDSGSQNSSGTGGEPVAKTVEVEINNMAFKSPSLSVKRGTTVKWTNKDSMQHTVSSTAGVENKPQSELLARGESYSFTFTKAGSFAYFCELHPQMKGSVKVE